jgi:hypothetical protein
MGLRKGEGVQGWSGEAVLMGWQRRCWVGCGCVCAGRWGGEGGGVLREVVMVRTVLAERLSRFL